jgi:predicted transcriptional regulator YdeE
MTDFHNLPPFPTLSIIEFPALELAGLKVRTTMLEIQRDCPALWECFGPRMFELSGKDACPGFQGESYGASVPVDMDNGTFDYWAAMPVKPGEALPAGMERLGVAPGLYAACALPSLAELGAAYNYIYLEWLPGQSEYTLNMASPCFERYDQRYLESGVFDVLVPLLKKV